MVLERKRSTLSWLWTSSNRFAQPWLPGLLLLASLAGCAPRPYVNQHIEQVNSEYRELENSYYLLEDENQQLCFEIDKLEAELDRLKGGGRRPSSSAGQRPGGLFAPRNLPSDAGDSTKPMEPGGLAPPSIEIPEIEIPMSEGSSTPAPMPRRSNRPSLDPPAKPTSELPELEVPMIEMPEASEPSLLPQAETPPVDTPKVDRPKVDVPKLETPPVPTIETDVLPPPESAPSTPEPIGSRDESRLDPQITHVKLNPQMTAGANFDSEPGDDGLMILVEPRNRFEQTLSTAGPMSLVLLDPAEQGEKARIARWDFAPEEIDELRETTPQAGGILLKLPWPSRPPTNRKLRLYVRYETSDGRLLETDREVLVAGAGESSNRWAPRTREASTSRTGNAAQPSNPAAVIRQPSAGDAAPAPAARPEPVARQNGAAADVETPGAPNLLMPPAALGDPAAMPQARPRWQPYR